MTYDGPCRAGVPGDHRWFTVTRRVERCAVCGVTRTRHDEREDER